ncbi:hypothetical protein CN187_17910 [Sinorhizobium meliloti]|uniref:hypothetical protein n=1 Tax=Rhizobium meliloti TaxID=382 RepID=UPI000FDA628E|nr:hypothetical protein [Sinorhizobium meliloti]RVI66065.1 hypothetical protein CN187_17910 [Sinorhizobium meliloti]
MTIVQSCATVIVPSVAELPAAEPDEVDPVVLAVVSPETLGVVPAAEPLAFPDALPVPAADAVCIVLQSCLIWFCCSAVSFDQFALISSWLRKVEPEASEKRALRTGSGHFDVVFLSASFICIIPGVPESLPEAAEDVVPAEPDVLPDVEPELL